jgi:hypothetical protein
MYGTVDSRRIRSRRFECGMRIASLVLAWLVAVVDHPIPLVMHTECRCMTCMPTKTPIRGRIRPRTHTYGNRVAAASEHAHWVAPELSDLVENQFHLEPGFRRGRTLVSRKSSRPPLLHNNSDCSTRLADQVRLLECMHALTILQHLITTQSRMTVEKLAPAKSFGVTAEAVSENWRLILGTLPLVCCIITSPHLLVCYIMLIPCESEAGPAMRTCSDWNRGLR